MYDKGVTKAPRLQICVEVAQHVVAISATCRCGGVSEMSPPQSVQRKTLNRKKQRHTQIYDPLVRGPSLASTAGADQAPSPSVQPPEVSPFQQFNHNRSSEPHDQHQHLDSSRLETDKLGLLLHELSMSTFVLLADSASAFTSCQAWEQSIAFRWSLVVSWYPGGLEVCCQRS